MWELHSQYRVSPEITSNLRHADIVRMLAELQAVRPEAMPLSELGTSYEGRSIWKASLGNGPTKIFAWSQMHGNEPTHTAVLLDLINFLQRSPEDPIAKVILSECTLHLVPMLNPDGAERYIRRNAQAIDINRDALLLQSPEGRLLRQTVFDLQPDIALNLHNQTPRTSVGSNPTRVAAVSLLVPPIDAVDTQTDGTRLAKQLADKFVEAVEPHCAGLISRYDADFMPRCFGEWVQQQGAATLTVEAGGWTTPLTERSPLVQVHFLGTLSVLESIANESYESADPIIYDQLPRSGGHDLFDLAVRNTRIVLNKSGETARSDIGINFHSTSSDHQFALTGRIADLGDLSVTDGKIEFIADDCICLPGRFALLPEINPTNLPSPDLVAEMLQSGVTSLLGSLDLSSSAQRDALLDLGTQLALPINVGFLADLDSYQGPESQANLIRALSQGVLGAIGTTESTEAQELLDCFGIVPIAHGALSFALGESSSLEEYFGQVQQGAQLLKHYQTGPIALGSSADLVFLQSADRLAANQSVDWSLLRRVLVSGNVVWDKGELTPSPVGRLLVNDFRAART